MCGFVCLHLLNLRILGNQKGVLRLFDGLLRVRVALFLGEGGGDGHQHSEADEHFHFCSCNRKQLQIFPGQCRGPLESPNGAQHSPLGASTFTDLPAKNTRALRLIRDGHGGLDLYISLVIPVLPPPPKSDRARRRRWMMT